MSSSFRVCSYDFSKTINNEPLGELNKNEQPLLDQADIYLFQGVGITESNPELNTLRGRKFEIVHIPGYVKSTGLIPIDTVIAFSSEKFDFYGNESEEISALNYNYRYDMACAQVINKQNGQQIALISSQTPRLNSEHGIGPLLDADSRAYSKYLAHKIASAPIANSSVQIIGSNMNSTNLENPTSFKLITEPDFVFYPAPDGSRKHFIFIRTLESFASKVASIFCRTIKNRITFVNPPSLEQEGQVTPLINGPLYIDVTSTVKDSKIVELLMRFAEFFKRLLCCLSDA